MDEKRKQELQNIQEMAVDHASEEMSAAATLGLATKEDRGDRGFLTGMASKSLGVAVKIEQFKILMERPKTDPLEEEENEHRAADRLVKQARADLHEIMERARAGAKPRA